LVPKEAGEEEPLSVVGRICFSVKVDVRYQAGFWRVCQYYPCLRLIKFLNINSSSYVGRAQRKRRKRDGQTPILLSFTVVMRCRQFISLMIENESVEWGRSRKAKPLSKADFSGSVQHKEIG